MPRSSSPESQKITWSAGIAHYICTSCFFRYHSPAVLIILDTTTCSQTHPSHPEAPSHSHPLSFSPRCLCDWQISLTTPAPMPWQIVFSEERPRGAVLPDHSTEVKVDRCLERDVAKLWGFCDILCSKVHLESWSCLLARIHLQFDTFSSIFTKAKVSSQIRGAEHWGVVGTSQIDRMVALLGGWRNWWRATREDVEKMF